MTVTGSRASDASRPLIVRQQGWRATLLAFVALTKPRIIELLLVTTIPTMILAADGWPPIGIAVATLIGGTLAAAGANTFNSYWDRDIDSVMSRTKHRPLVTGSVSPRSALILAWVLSVVSVLFMAAATNALAALLTALSIFFYVVIYTMVLKRRTPQNIVLGGAAGCMPVLIGWSAVTGTLDWAALILFLIVFWWTPPHYWPLSLRFREDYRAAGVPMLPVVADFRRVAAEILVYSWLMVITSLALVPVAGMGPLYTVMAVALGVAFLWEATALRNRVRRGVDPRAMRLFHGSISYLSLLFLAIALDPLLF